MPKFVIKRDIPGIGKLSPEEQKKVARNSNRALNAVGPDIQWLHSYIRENGTHCVYIAANEDLIYEHAERAGAPVTEITKVETMLDPTSAED